MLNLVPKACTKLQWYKSIGDKQNEYHYNMTLDKEWSFNYQILNSLYLKVWLKLTKVYDIFDLNYSLFAY